MFVDFPGFGDEIVIQFNIQRISVGKIANLHDDFNHSTVGARPNVLKIGGTEKRLRFLPREIRIYNNHRIPAKT